MKYILCLLLVGCADNNVFVPKTLYAIQIESTGKWIGTYGTDSISGSLNRMIFIPNENICWKFKQFSTGYLRVFATYSSYTPTTKFTFPKYGISETTLIDGVVEGCFTKQ
mgnify:FL=1